jgi:hypothetical protein
VNKKYIKKNRENPKKKFDQTRKETKRKGITNF